MNQQPDEESAGFSTHDARIMDSLKDKLKEVVNYFDTTRRVVFYDYPLYLNVGDLLIQQGTEQFFAENKIHVWKRYSVWDMPSSIRGMDDDVVIVCHGGGNFGDLYQSHHESRERVLQLYPRNPIVILPQTVYFNSRDLFRQSMEILRAHRNCHIFARDARSLEILRTAGIQRTSAMPDMAHCLWGRLRAEVPSSYQERPMLFVRRDKESKPFTTLHRGEPEEQTWDWNRIIRLSTSRYARLLIAAIERQGKTGMHNQKYWQWRSMQERAIRDGVRFFSRFRKIYTNRLHAMILGLLLEREVCAFDNSYGKLSAYRDTWLSEMDSLSWEPDV